MKTIEGKLFRVRLAPRGGGDPHVAVTVEVEDDGNWHPYGTEFSSHWLSDLITTLQAAESVLEKTTEPDPSGYGYRFKRA